MNNPDIFRNLFPTLLENSAQEVGDLIGETLELQEETSRSGRLREAFSPPKKKFGRIGFDIKGAQPDAAHLVFDLDLAIELGGRLLMLPADEIAGRKKQGEIEGELLDAFSEIANIISGVITSVWQEAFPEKKLHFLKGNIEQFPQKSEDIGLPEENLTVLSGGIALEGKPLGQVQFLLPHRLLVESETAENAAGAENEAAPLNPTEPEQRPEPEPRRSAAPDSTGEAVTAPGQKTVPGQKSDTAEDEGGRRIISIIGEDPSQFAIVEDSFAGEGVRLNRLLLSSDLKESLSREAPSCVFLLIDKVNDQGLAKTIKVRAALKNECPLIVAGPEWTRTTVLKARKYGATDVLITPADGEAIRKKYRKYL